MHSIAGNCDGAFAGATAVIGDKWSLQLVFVLSQADPRRFNELLEAVAGICPRTLSARLDKLETSGIIEKQVHATVPVRVDYGLTAKGRALLPVIEALHHWGAAYAA